MDNIIYIAQQLAKEGKTPNTALIKARLPKKTPLPLIIEGLKCWKDTPNKQVTPPTNTSTVENEKPTQSNSIDELIEKKIAQAVAPLTAQIDELTKQLDQLNQRLKIEQVPQED